MVLAEGYETLWHYVSHKAAKQADVPSISVTSARRVSVSSPLRFTRTFSNDSLDSLEKVGRKELRIKAIVDKESPTMSLLPSPSFCPHMAEIGRSRTEGDSDVSKIPASLRRSISDVNRRTPSPTSKPLAEFIGLTPYQQKLLVQCWPNIYGTGPNGQFANSIYSKLCSRNPKAKQLLAKANCAAVFANSDVDCTVMHMRITVELVDTAMKNIDNDHTPLTSYIQEVGRSHRQFRSEGLVSSVWDELGDCLVDAVRRYEAVRKHKELRRAWLALIAYITDNLKQGQLLPRQSSSYDLSDKPPLQRTVA